MKKYLIALSALIFFGFTPPTHTQGKVTNNKFTSSTFEKSSGKVFTADDIYVSFDYLTDATGYKYGAVFYLYNPNNFVVSIQWQFVGYYNVNFSPSNSDRTTIPAKTKIWITNVTSADHSKAWSSGKVQWKY